MAHQQVLNILKSRPTKRPIVGGTAFPSPSTSLATDQRLAQIEAAIAALAEALIALNDDVDGLDADIVDLQRNR